MKLTVLRALGLGDLLTAVPALRALRRAFPDAQIVLGTPAGLRPLIDLIGADLDVVDLGPYLNTSPIGPLPTGMQNADLAVNLHGAGPQSTAVLREAWPRRLISYGVTAAWRTDEHEVARWCRLLAEAGMAADPTDLALSRPLPESPAPGAVVMHPGAASGARRWPADRWATVAAALAREGHRVVVTGSQAEAELAAAVAATARLPPAAVLAGTTPLATLAALISDAVLVLCGDTGVAHLATAYSTPSVVLFGPTPPALWGPPQLAQHRVLWAGHPDDPRAADPHAAEPSPGLLALSAEPVLAAAHELLARRQRRQL